MPLLKRLSDVPAQNSFEKLGDDHVSNFNHISPVRCAVRPALWVGTFVAMASHVPLAIAQQSGSDDEIEAVVVTGSRLI